MIYTVFKDGKSTINELDDHTYFFGFDQFAAAIAEDFRRDESTGFIKINGEIAMAFQKGKVISTRESRSAESDALSELLRDFKCYPLTNTPNYYLTPITRIDALSEDGCSQWNAILDAIHANPEIGQLRRTRSGGISYGTPVPSYDLRRWKNGAEITLLYYSCYRIQFRPRNTVDEDTEKPNISGHKAFMALCHYLAEDGINIKDYAVENGAEIKATIEPPMIQFEDDGFTDWIFENAHHIDYHSSYALGLANTHPEMRKTLETCYKRRKKRPIYKAILNYFVGYCQSANVNYRYSALSKGAIEDNNRRVRDLAERLKAAGRTVILYNTDGIWYDGEVYHDDGEGAEFGTWANDHVNCRFRAKSAGAYEYIEGGKYHAIMRGKTTLDREKPRTEWEWGDIYRAGTMTTHYTVDEDGHITEAEDG